MDSVGEAAVISKGTTESLLTEEVARDPISSEPDSSNGGFGPDDRDEEEQLIHANQDITTSTVDDITKGELWYELEKELQKQDNTPNIHAQEEEAAAAKEITEEEIQLADAVEGSNPITTSDSLDNHHFYPLAESCILSLYLLHRMIQIQLLMVLSRNMSAYMKHLESCTASSGSPKP